MLLRRLIALALLGTLGATAAAREIHVDNLAGYDGLDGSPQRSVIGSTGPVRTIAKALRLARPGDRIVLTKTSAPYRESVALVGSRLSESLLTPLILDGGGAVLDGTAPVPADRWEHHLGDVFCFAPERLGYQQLYLAGRPALRRPTTPADYDLPELEPLEWCLAQGKIYFRVEAGRLPEQYPLSYCVLGTGLRLYSVQNVVIRDLTVQGFQLDGIAVCDVVRGALFQRVTARGNGRCGISVAGDSQIEIEDSTLAGNGLARLRHGDYAQSWLYRTKLLDDTARGLQLLGGRVTVDGTAIEKAAR